MSAKTNRLITYLALAFVCGLTQAIDGLSTYAQAQNYDGPMLPHVGGEVTTSFQSSFGPDAEGYTKFTAVTPSFLSIDYSSTRGTLAKRNINIADRQSSRIYVIGYSPNMPILIPGSTSLGISGASVAELRNTGRTDLSLIYDEGLSKIDGELVLIAKDIKVEIIVEDRPFKVPALHVTGRFGSGNHTATGDFYFLDNVNNPMMLQSTIKFSWESEPRTEKITRVMAGASMRSAMEQALNTIGRYDHYGIHFDFGKATIQPATESMIDDIAVTLKNNSTWRLKINGHTDSIGGASENLRLSEARANSVKNALVGRGISPDRLQTAGLGESQPKADNGTLQGRALNRRVELVRTDR
jgi:outer membrane protein OmpA-like peptidoglycan-associated protein